MPYDERLATARMIVPEFVDEVVGWANEDDLRAAGMDPIEEMGRAVAVGWVGPAGIDPEPIVVTELRWRWWRMGDG